MMQSKEEIDKQRLEQKRVLLKQARELKQVSQMVLIVKQQQERKIMEDRLRLQRDRIVKAYLLKQQERKNMQNIYNKTNNGQYVFKPMTDSQRKNFINEHEKIQKEYREVSNQIDIDKAKAWTKEYLEKNHRSEWNKSDYVSKKTSKEYAESKENLKEKVKMSSKGLNISDLDKVQNKIRANTKQQVEQER